MIELTISEGIDINKTGALKWYFSLFLIRFQQYVFNGYHDLMVSVNSNNIAILNICSVDCGCNIMELVYCFFLWDF